MKVLTKLRWVMLLLLPFVIYDGDISAYYGFRDDYSTLREARTGTDVVVSVNSSHGRPVYGWLLQSSFSWIDGIKGLIWARLAAALILGCLAVLVAWILEVQLAWDRLPAWLIGGSLVTVPASQIYVHWAICWPIVLAAVFSALAFAVAHRAWEQGSFRSRALGGSAAFLLLLIALLDYQPNALLFAVLMAAGWIASLNQPLSTRLARLTWQITLVSAALLTAFVVCQLLFALSLANQSPRFAVESHWLEKLVWSAGQPLENALALSVLEDEAGRTEPWHLLAAIIVGATILFHGIHLRRKHGWSAACCWWVGFPCFALLAYAVSFLAAEHWPTYRTMLPLTGVVLVYFYRAVSNYTGSSLRTSALLLPVFAGSALLASHDSHQYITVEQQTELAGFETAATQLDLAKVRRVALLLPNPEDSTADIHYLDEYGSLSDDAPWCAKEMLLQVLHAHFPDQAAGVDRLQVSECFDRPDPADYDILIDLRTNQDLGPSRRPGSITSAQPNPANPARTPLNDAHNATPDPLATSLSTRPGL